MICPQANSGVHLTSLCAACSERTLQPALISRMSPTPCSWTNHSGSTKRSRASGRRTRARLVAKLPVSFDRDKRRKRTIGEFQFEFNNMIAAFESRRQECSGISIFCADVFKFAQGRIVLPTCCRLYCMIFCRSAKAISTNDSAEHKC